MIQQQLFPTPCPCEDDNGVVCGNNMSDEEIEQDGYCVRCAAMLSEWTRNMDKPFVFKKEQA